MSGRQGGIALPVGDVHVWYVDLDRAAIWWERLAPTLALDERERAARLRHERQRRRFVVGRGVLRAILGAYLGLDPARVRLTRTTMGKPCLAHGAASLRFNLSHAHELAVYALARRRKLGIDVEARHHRLSADMLEIAEACFAEQEKSALRRLEDAERQAAFLRAWTRKEAWLKATGKGLAFPLDRVRVSLGEGEPARLLAVDGDAGEAARWSLHELPLPSGHMAALAVNGPVRRCVCRAWPGHPPLDRSRHRREPNEPRRQTIARWPLQKIHRTQVLDEPLFSNLRLGNKMYL